MAVGPSTALGQDSFCQSLSLLKVGITHTFKPIEFHSLSEVVNIMQGTGVNGDIFS